MNIQFLNFVLFAFLFSGCMSLSTNFNTATDQQETTLYSTDQEQKLGASVALEVEKQFDLVDDPVMNARVDRITERVAAACDRKELVYVTRVIDIKPKDRDRDGEKMINAVSLPGGYIYMFKDLMDYVPNDDELAAVIAHEVAHITARHSIKRIQASYGSLLATIAAIATRSQAAGGVLAALDTMFWKYSQEDEIAADTLGVKYLEQAGYDPQGMVGMLEKLKEYNDDQPIRPKMYSRSHPYIHERIASASQVVSKELTFRDYIRMTGERGRYAP